DVLYAIVTIWIIIRVVKISKATIRKKVTRMSIVHSFQKTTLIIISVYIFFNVAWGLNYDRMGIAYQLQLQPQAYDTQDLKRLAQELILKVNDSRKKITDSSFYNLSNREVFVKAKDAYTIAQKQYPFLNYKLLSVKSSLYGTAGNYLGFLGYYTPFTGEA